VNDRQVIDIERDQVLQRFFALPRRQQLEVFSVMRDFLADGVRPESSAKDEMIDGQRAALEAMAAVARELGLPDGKPPTTTQFDEAAPRVAPGWTSDKVLRTFKARWRVVCEVYKEGRVGLTTLQLGLERSQAGRTRHHEGYWTALHKWLGTKPPLKTTTAYTAFISEYNDQLPPGEKPLPTVTALRDGLKLNFPEMVRVAEGEIALEDAKPYTRRKLVPLEDKEGPDGLVPAKVAATICGEASKYAHGGVVFRPGFPTPVLVTEKLRFWHRDDVEAYAAGNPLPQRTYNELGHRYMTVKEMAELAGTRRESVVGLPGVPEPAVVVGRQRLYLRSEVEEALPEMQRIVRHRRKFVSKSLRTPDVDQTIGGQQTADKHQAPCKDDHAQEA
jgi:hypothetical protein